MKRHVLLTDEEIALLNHLAERHLLHDLKHIVERATRPNTEEEADYIQRAREDYEEEGTLEFDDTPLVSDSDEGACVMAWAWVGKEQ